MRGEPVNAAAEALVCAREFHEKSSRPVGLVAIWAAGDEVERRVSKIAQVGRVTFVFCRVILRTEVAAAAPRFVANAPILYPQRHR